MKKILLIIFTLSSLYGYAQTYDVTISGNANPLLEDPESYTVDWTYENGIPGTPPGWGSGIYNWDPDNGVVMTSEEDECTVVWLGIDAGTLLYEYETWDNYYSDYFNVTVEDISPTAPLAFTATDTTDVSFAASWSSVAGAASYRLDVSTVASFTSYVASYSVSSNNINVSGLNSSTYYYFRARAVNASDEISDNSNTISVLTLPSAPIASEATNITGTSFTANWIIVPSATSYRLDVSSDGFATFQQGYYKLPVNGLSQSVVGLITGTTYSYRVRAEDGSNASANSNEITVGVGTELNFIRTISITVEGLTASSQVENATFGQQVTEYSFFDGLGRPMQTVVKEGSPSGNDIVQPIVYDEFGRETRKYLPFIANETNGWFKNNIINTTTHAYQNSAADFYTTGAGTIPVDAKPYAETVFEASPLNRILKQGAPGEAWQPDGNPLSMEDRTVKRRYGTNAAEEVYLFTYDAATGLANLNDNINEKFYQPNQLYSNKTLDEHNNEMIEYVDKEGRTVCKKVQYGTQGTVPNVKLYAATYYVYDDFGNLVVVLPPEASKQFEELASEN